ncbi:F0F1 ATP synthase subunit A [Pseudokineococcus sp. 1T1Z-3]|uniref:F0F1 ATP synthase subunit A n=1 Tax=Pseudokineococcus sp. 1T1Z-3 TaxID=3132745 RepID=UPI0030B30A04
MSPHVLASGYSPPSPSSFWHPLIGEGATAITRPMFLMAFSVLLITALAFVVTRRMSLVPGSGQFVAEGIYTFVRNGVARDSLGSKEFLAFVPLLLTQFLLIFTNNLFGIVPVIQFPTFSRYGFALSVTLIVFVVYHVVGIRRKGLGGYFRGMVPSGLPKLVVPVIFLLELLTYFVTRPLTLSLRLFANMFAGHILLLVFFLGGTYMLVEADGLLINVASVGAFLMGIVFTGFELLIYFLQAYVFVLLSASYIATSIADDH